MHAVLEASPLLKASQYQPVCEELCRLVKEFLDRDKKENFSPLIEAFARELEVALLRSFIPDCISWLTHTLMQPSTTGAPDPELPAINAITGQMLSCLVGDGWSLESLFSLYRRAFSNDPVHLPAGEAYRFICALQWVFARLVSAPKPYVVTFAINQITDVEAFPPQVGDIQFSVDPPALSGQSELHAKKLATKDKFRVFATMSIPAKDSRIAGMRAASHIEQVLDVVRYDFERKNFHLSEKFLVEKVDRHIVLEVSRTVPNHKQDMLPGALHLFMQRLDELMSNGKLEEDAKDRIYSAFRLYRTGAETGNLENKLVNWWTALEFLVKAGGAGNIGEAVENALYPTVTLAYLTKHLLAIRAVAHLMRVKLPNPTTGLPVVVGPLPLPDLYRYCQTPAFQTGLLAAVAAHPYAVLHIGEFLRKITTSKQLGDTLKHHERRVRWQIQRIYRARCDIVHSAGRVVQAGLLCANLESYLKILLDTFLQSLHRHSTLHTPKEFFERQRHTFDRVSAQLASNDNTMLMLLLARDTES